MKMRNRMVAATAAMAILMLGNNGILQKNAKESYFMSASAAEIVDSGECGHFSADVNWTLDSEGTLIISGEGKMDNWLFDSPFANNTEIKKLIVEDGVTTLGERAFMDCTSLTSVTLPNSLVSINYAAFSNCDALETITIPDSVTILDEYAFSGCEALTSITFPPSVTTIGDVAFSGCNGLTSVTIPPNVTSIGVDAFAWCKGLTSITIENPQCEIGDAYLTFYEDTVIYGHKDSTAQAYAEAYAREFRLIEDQPAETPSPDNPVIGYSYQFPSSDLHFYFSDDTTQFKPEEIVTSVTRYEEYADGTRSEEGEVLQDFSFMEFDNASPASMYQEGTSRYTLQATLTDQFKESKQNFEIFIGAKGDANLDGVTDAKDGAAILVFAAAQGAGTGSILYSDSKETHESFAKYLANVSASTPATIPLDSRDAAAILTYAAAAGSGSKVEWEEILGEEA